MKTDKDIERLNNLKDSLEEELDEIARQNLIGEGQAAKVFNIKTANESLPLCAKMIRPELEKMSPIERKRRQYLSPDEEFNLQEKLFEAGFPTPEPIARKVSDKYNAIIMERIIGYTLAEIDNRGGLIVEPSWSELDGIIDNLNRNHRVVHRDLHLGNIMLQTRQTIENDRNSLKGKIYIIDFGTSKRIFGQATEEDYNLTIGNNVIRYTSDGSSVRMLKPRMPGIRGETPFLF